MNDKEIGNAIKSGKYVLFGYWGDGLGDFRRDLVAARDESFFYDATKMRSTQVDIEETHRYTITRLEDGTYKIEESGDK